LKKRENVAPLKCSWKESADAADQYIIGRKKNSTDVRLFRSRNEMLKKRDAVARQRVFGAQSLRGARIIIERDIKT